MKCKAKTERFFALSSILLVFILVPRCSNLPEEGSDTRPNVLFVIVDDLRPELPSYGNGEVHAPAISRIAESGVVFENAYCQYPVCGPSRCSLLSGLRPTTERFTSNRSQLDREEPEIIPMPQHFKEHGYYTISNGKVYHDHGNVMDGMDGWSELPWEPHPGFWVWLGPESREHSHRGYKYRQQTVSRMGPAWEALDVPDNAYPTGVVTDKSIQDLQRLAKMNQPFFLAVGYRKPHLPMNAPKKYWDLYDPDELPLPDNYLTAREFSEYMYTKNGELRNYGNIPDEEKIPAEDWHTLLHGYYACISYTDAQIERLLDEMDRLGLSENTIVVVVGDHGYHLGEFRIWGKNNPFWLSLRAPLIISVPWQSDGRGFREMVEFIDIYPTLAGLCGLEMPDHPVGMDLSGLWENDHDFSGKAAAFARVGECEVMVTPRYTYSEWRDDRNRVYARRLYDRIADPAEREDRIGDPAYSVVRDSLSVLLNRHLVNRR